MKHIITIIGIICIPYAFIGLLFLLSGFSFSYTETVTAELFYFFAGLFWFAVIFAYCAEHFD